MTSASESLNYSSGSTQYETTGPPPNGNLFQIPFEGIKGVETYQPVKSAPSSPSLIEAVLDLVHKILGFH